MVTDETTQWVDLKRFCEEHSYLPEKRFRWFYFRHGRAMEEAGAVIRLGRRIVVDPPKMGAWFREHKANVHSRRGR